jgi:diacylglycerol kinase (ATP)
LKRKICFIINPIAGIGKQKNIERVIAQYIDASLFDYEIKYTTGPKQATMLAQQAVKENVSIVVAVGGDGSINEVAKGLLGSGTFMGIIPAGSGNGLARHLKIPLDVKKAIRLLNRGRIKTIDTIRLNDEFFLNAAGVGFDAHIGWEFSRYGTRGFLSYVKIILREFPSYKEQEYEITIGDKTLLSKAFLITFANGSQWGNNAYISPLSVIDDGMMEIVLLKNVTLFNFFYLAFKLLNKKLHLTSHVEILKVKEAIIKQKKTIAHIDGEPVETGATIVLKVNPSSLKIIAP